jgi:maleate cis-trans isomerase
MFTDALPKKKIGYLSPRHVIHNHPYEFYHMAPRGVMLVMVSCGLDEFTAADVERVTKPLDKMLDRLVECEVDIISQTGVPLPLLIGMEAHDALIEHIADHTKLPASSQLLNVIAGVKHLGLKNVLLVNKWTDAMNETLEAFLDREGVSVAGVYNKSLTPAQFSKMSASDSAQLAYDLSVQAYKEHPEADGLYIGGGNWMSQPVCDQLELETGKPTVCNLGCMMWNMLHRLDMWQPIPGHGKLLAGD